MKNALKKKVKTTFHPESLVYNGLAWNYSYVAFKPAVRRAAYMRVFKDSRFHEEELEMASSRLEHLLDAVLERYHPAGFLDVGCGTGHTVGESVEQPLLHYKNNFTATLTLLTSMLSFRSIPVVFSSSCASYGSPECTPVSENHPQRPINPYGHSKLFVERLLADLDVAYGLPWVSLRYFNAAGADPDSEIGEAHEPETHLIPW
jgi:UDP-glucose 4-epimerase